MADIGNIETATQLILAEALCDACGVAEYSGDGLTVKDFLDVATQNFDSGNMRPEAVDTLQMAVEKATQFCDRNFEHTVGFSEATLFADDLAATAELGGIIIEKLRQHVPAAVYADILARSTIELEERGEDDEPPCETTNELMQYAVAIANRVRGKGKKSNVVQFPKTKQFPKRK